MRGMNGCGRWLLGVAAALGGCGGGADGAGLDGGGGGEGGTIVRYVERGQPVAGAPVLVSSLLGDPLFEGSTDAAGEVRIEPELEAAALLTIGRTQLPSIFVPHPTAPVFSRVIEPGAQVTVGTTAASLDGEQAGTVHPVFTEEFPDAYVYQADIGTAGGLIDNLGYIEELGLTVSSRLVARGTAEVLVSAYNVDYELIGYSAIEVDLTMSSGGRLEVAGAPWQTDLDQVEVELINLTEQSGIHAAALYLREGALYGGPTASGTFPGSPVPPSTTVSLAVPASFGDGLLIEAVDVGRSDFTTRLVRQVSATTPESVQIDIGALAPPPCVVIDGERAGGLLRFEWGGGGGAEDAVQVVVDRSWELVLPPGSREVVLPVLPAALADHQPPQYLDVEVRARHVDHSAATDYERLMELLTAGEVDVPAVGDSLSRGSCSAEIRIP